VVWRKHPPDLTQRPFVLAACETSVAVHLFQREPFRAGELAVLAFRLSSGAVFSSEHFGMCSAVSLLGLTSFLRILFAPFSSVGVRVVCILCVPATILFRDAIFV
jgi:hypothetical protein